MPRKNKFTLGQRVKWRMNGRWLNGKITGYRAKRFQYQVLVGSTVFGAFTRELRAKEKRPRRSRKA